MPLLVHFNAQLLTFIETDASGFAVAVILSQHQEDNHRHLVTFYSRKMTDTERNYITGDEELLAIVMAFK